MNNEVEETYVVDVSVAIRKVGAGGYNMNDRMEFRNSSTLGSLNLAQIAGLLMRFQELNDQAVKEVQET